DATVVKFGIAAQPSTGAVTASLGAGMPNSAPGLRSRLPVAGAGESVVTRPIFRARLSVNQRLPSGPAAIPDTLPELVPAPAGYSAIAPAGVIRPILCAP